MIEIVREVWDYKKGIQRKVYKFKKNENMKLMLDNEVYAIQLSPFHTVEQDWNCDNDIYELYGAYFNINGYNGNDFLTGEDIVFMIEEKNLKVVY